MKSQNDISQDAFLDEEANRHLAQVLAVKKHIYSYINQAELIKFLLHVIDGAGFVSFERQTDRRFIKLHNLSLSLLFDIKKAKLISGTDAELSLSRDGGNRDAVMDTRSELLRAAIVGPFSSMMNTMLHVILHGEIPEDFEYTEWMMKILPDDFEKLSKSINNFAGLEEKNRDKLTKDFSFLFRMASAFVFPPESVDINVDTGFTLEFLL